MDANISLHYWKATQNCSRLHNAQNTSLFTDSWLILKTLKLFLKEELFEFGDPTSIILNSKMPPPNSSILRCKAETREGPLSAGHD